MNRHVPLTRRAAVAVSTLALAAVSASGPAITPAGAAAELPDTLAAAAKASASALNVAHRSTIDDPKDQDWYKFQVPRTARAAVTLGGLPGDYSLAVYNSAGQRVGLSAYGGTHFERIFLSVGPGTYYARVATQGYFSKTKPYRLHFRVLPTGVITLDQRKVSTPGSHGVIATIYNNSSQWRGSARSTTPGSTRRSACSGATRRHARRPLGHPAAQRPAVRLGRRHAAGRCDRRLREARRDTGPAVPVPAVSVSGVARTRNASGMTYTGTASAGSKRVNGFAIARALRHVRGAGRLVVLLRDGGRRPDRAVRRGGPGHEPAHLSRLRARGLG